MTKEEAGGTAEQTILAPSKHQTVLRYAMALRPALSSMQCDKGFPVSLFFSGPTLIGAGVRLPDEVPWMGRNSSNRCNTMIVYGNACISFGLDGVVLVSSRTRTLQDAAHSMPHGKNR